MPKWVWAAARLKTEVTQTEAEGASYWSLQKLLDCRFYRARASGVDFVRHCKFVVRGVTFYLNESTAKEVTKLAELIRQPEGFGHDVMPSIRGGGKGEELTKRFQKSCWQISKGSRNSWLILRPERTTATGLSTRWDSSAVTWEIQILRTCVSRLAQSWATTTLDPISNYRTKPSPWGWMAWSVKMPRLKSTALVQGCWPSSSSPPRRYSPCGTPPTGRTSPRRLTWHVIFTTVSGKELNFSGATLLPKAAVPYHKIISAPLALAPVQTPQHRRKELL